jgi:hypothetical protein
MPYSKKNSSVSKQERAQVKRGGTQPSGLRVYLSGKDDLWDGQRFSYTAKPGQQRPGSKLAPKKLATLVSGNAAYNANLRQQIDRRKSQAAKKSASPGPRMAKRVAERTQPKRANLRMKKK